jgi:hypothetical protein
MLKLQLSKIIPFTILPLTILSVEYENMVPIGNPIFWWIVSVLMLLAFWKVQNKYFKPTDKHVMRVLNWYLIWNLICIIRGVFIVENYWDWRVLMINGLGLLMPIVAFSVFNIKYAQDILSFYIKYVAPLFFIFVFTLNSDVYGFYLVPFCFLALFFPVLTKTWRWIVLAIALFVIITDLTARSNVLRFAAPIALSFLYFFRFVLSTKIFELVRKLLIVTPILFFFLAVSGSFNVFNMQEYIKGDYIKTRTDMKGQKIEDDLLADSRSLIYIEVLQTAVKLDTWWLGRSPARGTISEMFGETDMTGRGERAGNEVGILNVFTWTGIVGVVLYLLVFYKASYMAVCKSNNVFSKILGIFVAFRWAYAWVEDINEFTLNYFMIWFMIGMCFSESFRKMTDKEVKIWILGIFEKKKTLSRKMIFNRSNFQQKN